MVKYQIKLYPRAYRDMEEIYRYIAIEKQVPENAKAQTDRIWRAIKKLETFPGSPQDRLEGKYAGKGYKQLLVDNYMAIYKIDETEKTVYVITVKYPCVPTILVDY